MCNIGLQYDDGNVSEGNYLAIKVLSVRVLARNDAPAITDGPGAGDARVEICGDHCYVGAECDFTPGTNQGGGKYVELDRNLTLLQCAPDAASATYVHVSHCAFNPKTKQLELSFAPLAVLPAGVKPKISVQVQDDGYDETATGTYDANDVAQVTRVSRPLKSDVFSFYVDVAKFSQLFKPAVVVSQSGCVACHASIDGDFFTDFGWGHSSTRADFWDRTDPSGVYAIGDMTDTGYYHGFNTIEALSGKLYVPNRTVPQPTSSGTVDSSAWRFNFGRANGFNSIATLAELLSKPGRVQRLTADFMPTGYSGAIGTINTIMNPVINPNPASDNKVVDKFDDNGTSRMIEDITIDYPTSADIQAIDHRGRIDWTNATAAQVAFLGEVTEAGVTRFSGLTANAAKTAVINSGTVRCLGDVIVKGPLVLFNAMIETTVSSPCRFYVDGPIFIGATPDVQSDGIRVVQVPGADASTLGIVQITSTQAILMGGAPTSLNGSYAPWAPFIDPFYGKDLTKKLAALATQLGLTDDNFDGCGGAPNFFCGARYQRTTASSPTTPATNDATACAAGSPPIDRSVAWAPRTFNFSRLMINAAIMLSRYLGLFKGAMIAGFATFRCSALRYQYDPALAVDVPFPRLRTLQSPAHPKGLTVFDVVPQSP